MTLVWAGDYALLYYLVDYAARELDRKSTVWLIRTVQNENDRVVSREVVVALGYREVVRHYAV